MKKYSSLLLAAAAVAFATEVHAQNTNIAEWTFETSAPTTAGPFNPEIGAGSASETHAGAAVFSSPAGNGSTHSFSANTWAVGDFYQFQVSTVGFTGIQISYDQTSSATGPKTWQLEWSTDGSTFNTIGTTYNVLGNGTAPNPAWNAGTADSVYGFSDDLSSITSLDNQSTVFFRVVDTTTGSVNGGTVAATGTDRIDNFLVAVPEPSSIALLSMGGLSLAGLILIRRKK